MSPPDLPTAPGSSPFRAHARACREGVVLMLRGEFDLSGVETYRAAFAQAAQTAGEPIILDLTALGFIDSSGLSCLVESLRQCQGEGRTLSICDPSPQVSRVLELTGLAERLPRVPCPEDVAPEPAT